MTLALVHAEEHAMGRAKTPVIGDAILPAMFLPTKFVIYISKTIIMKIHIWKLTAVMLLGILSFSSCGDDDDAGTQEQDLVIKLSKDHEVVEIGKTIQLVAGFSPSDAPNKAHTWTSEDPQIATVDETGKVKGVSVGTTKITVTALANKATATCEIEVVDRIIAVTSVTLNSKEETISVGSTTQLTATVSPTTATDQNVVWTSSNNSVAIVNEDGLVKGLSVGSANITASAGGKSAVCAVTVTEKSVDFSNIKYSIQADGSLLVTGTVTPVGVNISEIGVCFSTETTPTIENNKHILNTTGLTVNKEINDLKSNTSYYARMYAKGDGEVYYGKTEEIKIPVKFTTQFKLETNYIRLFHNSYSTISTREYSLKISTPLIEGYNNLNVCYGVAPNPEITDNITTLSKSGGRLTANLSSLKSNQTYYVRAYSMKNGKPVYYPGEASFTTIGGDVDLKISYSHSISSYWYYCVDYKLPEEGTYEVLKTGDVWICKTINGTYDHKLYVTEGSGSIYTKSMKVANGIDYYIRFHNLDTDTYYELHTK